MFFKEIIGQKKIKEQLFSLLKSKKLPHSQCFIDEEGRGGLSFVLAFALALIYTEEKEEEFTRNGKQQLNILQETRDLHFVFPISTSSKVSGKPLCKDYLEEWREFITKTPYDNLSDWLSFIGGQNKTGNISVDEIDKLKENLQMTSFSGGNKVCVFWYAEKLNKQASNKLLKLIEEPPKNTFFLFVVQNEANLLSTIRSRCQLLTLPPLEKEDIEKSLIEEGVSSEESKFISRLTKGNYRTAKALLNKTEQLEEFETELVNCLRISFRAKKNKSVLIDLMAWSNRIGSWERVKQKDFISFFIDFIREALLYSYNADSLVFFKSRIGFDLKNLSPYIHSENILSLIKVFEESLYNINRNASPKIVFSTLSINLTRLLHKKEN